MDSNLIFFLFTAFLLILTIVIFSLEKERLRLFALITPAIISILVFGATFIKDNENMISSIDVGISIIGIAVTVWVGLNIYNVIEKNEVEKLKKDIQKLKKDSLSIEKTFNNKLSELDNQNRIVKENIMLAKIETNILKTEETQGKNTIEICSFYDEILCILEQYPHLKDDTFKSKVRLRYAEMFINTGASDLFANKVNKLLEEALILSENSDDVFLDQNIYLAFAKFYLYTGDLEKAIMNAKKTVEIDGYNFTALELLLKMLDEKNTDDSFLEMIDYVKENSIYICNFNIEDTPNILKSKYKDIYTSSFEEK